MEDEKLLAFSPYQVAKSMHNCKRYQVLLLEKAEVDLQVTMKKNNIQKLTKDVDSLSLEVEKAKLEEKWGIRRPGDRKSPAEETLRLCRLLQKDPDGLDGILQELCIHQSKVTGQVTDLSRRLRELEKR